MQDQRTGEAPFSQDSAFQHLGSKFGRLSFVDLPADDLSAVDVDDQIEVKESPRYRPGEPCGVLTPDLAWRLGFEAVGRFAASGWPGAAPAMVLSALSQDPVKG